MSFESLTEQQPDTVSLSAFGHVFAEFFSQLRTSCKSLNEIQG
ncbi:hypothetical protein KIPB_004248, partial [Kipferlia bialata]|eukprot:g4248.t1